MGLARAPLNLAFGTRDYLPHRDIKSLAKRIQLIKIDGTNSAKLFRDLALGNASSFRKLNLGQILMGAPGFDKQTGRKKPMDTQKETPSAGTQGEGSIDGALLTRVASHMEGIADAIDAFLKEQSDQNLQSMRERATQTGGLIHELEIAVGTSR